MSVEATQAVPWKNIPSEYHVSGDGVFLHRDGEKKSDEVQLTSVPAWVETVTRELNGKNWSIEVAWRDHDRVIRSQLIPYATLLSGTEQFSVLASEGLLILPRAVPLFAHYLSMCVAQPAIERSFTFPELGFHAWSRAEVADVLHFLTPSSCLSPSPHRLKAEAELCQGVLYDASKDAVGEVRYQPHYRNKAAAGYHASGDLAAWQELVRPFHQNDLFVFSMSFAFASMLTGICGVDVIIAHLYGQSSSGKTTALQLAMSVLGKAGDPQVPSASNVERWNTTANGVELLLSEHSGMLAAVDELGSSAETIVSVYNATAGAGRTRMTDSGQRREQRTWALGILSSGEVSMREKVEGASKRSVKTGELIRALDIPVASLATGEEEHLGDYAGMIANLKMRCGEIYGVAAPAFAQAVINHFIFASKLRQFLHQETDTFHKELKDAAALKYRLDAAHVRALRRFAFIQAAGIMASQTAVFPCSEEDISRAVSRTVSAWLEALPPLSLGEQAVESLRDYVIQNMGQILHYVPWVKQGGIKADVPIRLAAIWKNDLILFTKDQFRQACGDISEKEAVKYLKAKGMLQCEAGKNTYRFTSKFLEYKNVQFIAVNAKRLLSNEEINSAMEESAPTENQALNEAEPDSEVEQLTREDDWPQKTQKDRDSI
jgi:hypothetical protein